MSSSGNRPKGSDRGRIKNITQSVLEEEDAREKKKTKAQLEAARKERMMRARKRRARRRRRFILRIVLLLIILGIIAGVAKMVLSVGSGSGHDAKGLAAYADENYEVAVAEFKEAIARDEDRALYYVHLGMTYIEMKSYEEALGYCNQAEACATSDEDLLQIYRCKGIAQMYMGNYEDAITSFSEALSRCDKNQEALIDILYYKAETQKKAGQYEGAASDYSQIIAAEDDAGARMLRGMVYEEMGDYKNAEADLREAISQSRKNFAIYRALYRAMMAQGRNEEAAEVLLEALELAGSSAQDQFNAGMINIELGDYIEAQANLSTAYEKGYLPALLGMAEIKVIEGDFEGAAELYETFFGDGACDKQDPAVLAKGCSSYAYCLIGMDHFEKAMEYCNQGLGYGDRDADQSLSFNKIVALEKMARWDEAYNEAKAYAEKYPDDAEGMREYQFLETRAGQ